MVYKLIHAGALPASKPRGRWDISLRDAERLRDRRARRRRPRPPLATPIDQLFTTPFTYPQDANPAQRYLDGLDGATSRPSQRLILERCARELSGGAIGWQQLPWHLVRASHLEGFRDRSTGSGLAAATVNRGLQAARRVLEQCWSLGLTSAEDYLMATRVRSVAQ